MKFRRVLMAASAAAIPAAFLAASAGTAMAAKPLKTATYTGNITCVATGKATISPPLTISGPGTSSTFAVTVALKSCTATNGLSQGGATLTTGTVKISGTLTGSADSCLGLVSSGPPVTAGKVTWKSSTSTTIKPSSVSGFTGSASVGPPISLTLSGGSATGSFAGSGTAGGKIVLKQTEAQLLSACEGAGIGEVNLASGSSFTV